ncbi:GNAT family N-acetyltransferase [Patulibacter brassicae]|jgi:predicted GNAT family acetyltransferase|uniref:GNAT family N-acetyltransferase n=1 Tax=Patulibacter brassicae TaxID=1705717 RepID=A0ABU4VHH2_9ACTN|nr:GNAT family N-acetyltransferase [Patulibacter brassicae]MDX8150589.1 GNAT family N-acetyltransferase [Patulibacter brassicae]
MATEVRDNPEQHRFEAHTEDGLAGFAEYQLVRGDRIVFTHTEVDPAFGGRGIGTTLVAGALDAAVERGLAIVPICPFVARYVHEHPDAYVEHLDERIRKAFG